MKTDIILKVLGGLILFGFGMIFADAFLATAAHNLIGYWVMAVPALLIILGGYLLIQAGILYFKESKGQTL